MPSNFTKFMLFKFDALHSFLFTLHCSATPWSWSFSRWIPQESYYAVKTTTVYYIQFLSSMNKLVYALSSFAAQL
jgi:hypothetical protein